MLDLLALQKAPTECRKAKDHDREDELGKPKAEPEEVAAEEVHDS